MTTDVASATAVAGAPAEAAYERITVEPLTANLGAVIRNADLANVDDATWREIEQAFATHQVLFFRDQPLSLDHLRALGARLGPLHEHPVAPPVDGHRDVMRIHADGAS